MHLKIGLLAAAVITLSCVQLSRADFMSISFDNAGPSNAPTGVLNYSYVYGTHSSSGSLAETVTNQYDNLGTTAGYYTGSITPTPITFNPSPTAWILESQTNSADVADLIIFNDHMIYIFTASELSSGLETVSGLVTHLNNEVTGVKPVSILEAQLTPVGYDDVITSTSANKSGQMQYDGSGVPLNSFINFGSGAFAPAITTPLPSVASGSLVLIGLLAINRRRQMI
jgi:hypothetical protein